MGQGGLLYGIGANPYGRRMAAGAEGRGNLFPVHFAYVGIVLGLQVYPNSISDCFRLAQDAARGPNACDSTDYI